MGKFPHPGAYPSPVDDRDWLHSVVSKTNIKDIPVEGGVGDVPLIIHDQRDMPICTGEAGAYLQMINQYYETGHMLDLSSMFIYKQNKEIDGIPPDIEGSTVKATVQTLRLKGVCREILYPSNKRTYNSSLPQGRQMARIMRNAYRNRIVAYTKCQDLNDMLVALSEKRPVIFSLYLLSDFYNAERGIVPSEVGGDNVGGHAMVALKYNLEEEWVKVAQSWGGSSERTDRGYMYIPFSWFRYKLRRDFPLLMDAYTVLDYIPEETERLPQKLTVSKRLVNIEINGQRVKDMNIPPILINGLGTALVHTNLLEQIMRDLTGKEVKIAWDADNYTIKINI